MPQPGQSLLPLRPLAAREPATSAIGWTPRRSRKAPLAGMRRLLPAGAAARRSRPGKDTGGVRRRTVCSANSMESWLPVGVARQLSP